MTTVIKGTPTNQAGEAVALDINGKLPAVDGSLLTNLPTPAALSTASGSAPSYSARAWVNFNGTGTVAISASGNVSSITDNGVGSYTVNFTTAMPDASYAVIGGADKNTQSGGNNQMLVSLYTYAGVPTSAGCRIATMYSGSSSSFADFSQVHVSFFR